MKTAIIFLHWGNAQGCLHLNLALLQARLWNPHSEICVLADVDARAALNVPGIEVVPLEDYHSAAASFRRRYVHFSINQPEYTRFNIERWFVMRDFARARGLPRILHLDSDVLLYDDVEAAGQQFEECDLTLSCPSTPQLPYSSGHSSYFNLRALDEFCAFVESTYADPAKIASFEKRVAGCRATGGVYNIGDMNHLASFSFTTQLKIGYGQHGHPEFDPNFNYDVETKTRLSAGHKRIEYRNGQPHGLRTGNGKAIRYATLHFQGHAKECMLEHLQAPAGSQLPCDLIFPLIARLTRSAGQTLTECRSAVTANQKALHEALDVLSAVQRQCEGLKERHSDDALKLKTARQAMAQAAKQVNSAARSLWVKRGTQLGLTKSGAQLQSALDHLQILKQEQDPDSSPEPFRK